jgi:hypothetical protein
MKPRVLALEFRGVGDPADFAFLAEETDPASMERVDPLVDHVPRQLALDEQAKVLVERLPYPPELVFAYCAAAALGAHIAAVSAARLVLVDPYPVTAPVVRRDFRKLCERVGCDSREMDEDGALARREAMLLRTRDGLAAEFGGDEQAFEMVDDLLDRYRSWLRFLDASMTARPADPAGEVTVVAGRPLSPLGALLTRPRWARVHHVEVDIDTLESAEVRTLLTAAIAGTLND